MLNFKVNENTVLYPEVYAKDSEHVTYFVGINVSKYAELMRECGDKNINGEQREKMYALYIFYSACKRIWEENRFDFLVDEDVDGITTVGVICQTYDDAMLVMSRADRRIKIRMDRLRRNHPECA